MVKSPAVEPTFPAGIWDGTTATRDRFDDKKNVGGVDYWRLVRELQSTQETVTQIGDLASASWVDSVKSVFDPTPGLPLTPLDEDRYLAGATANGWTDENIYEWNATTVQWDETVPIEGMAVWIDNENKIYIYQDGTWVKLAATVSHGSLLSLTTDDHPQYVHLDNDRVITGKHSFAPIATQPPFEIGVNAFGEVVGGLNADQLDGKHAAEFEDSGAVAAHEGAYVHGDIHPKDKDLYLDFGNANQVSAADLKTHLGDTANPHSVSKAQVGLSNVVDGLQLQAANNLSDLADAPTALTNLGAASTSHHLSHISGGADAFLSTELIEAIVKRLQVTGPVTLTLGAVADGEFMKRVGSTIVGAAAGGGPHAASHTDGSDDIQDATAGQKGVATAAQITKLDGIEALANAYTHPAHSGDVTSIGDGATTIAAQAVTLAKMQNISSQRVLGRITAGSNSPEELTPDNLRSILGGQGFIVNVGAGQVYTTIKAATDAYNASNAVVAVFYLTDASYTLTALTELTKANVIFIGVGVAGAAPNAQTIIDFDTFVLKLNEAGGRGKYEFRNLEIMSSAVGGRIESFGAQHKLDFYNCKLDAPVAGAINWLWAGTSANETDRQDKLTIRTFDCQISAANASARNFDLGTTAAAANMNFRFEWHSTEQNSHVGRLIWYEGAAQFPNEPIIEIAWFAGCQMAGVDIDNGAGGNQQSTIRWWCDSTSSISPSNIKADSNTAQTVAGDRVWNNGAWLSRGTIGPDQVWKRSGSQMTGLSLGSLATLSTVDTAQINDEAVTLAKMANLTAPAMVGRITAGAGVPEELNEDDVRTITHIREFTATVAAAGADYTTLGAALDAYQASNAVHATIFITDAVESGTLLFNITKSFDIVGATPTAKINFSTATIGVGTSGGLQAILARIINCDVSHSSGVSWINQGNRVVMEVYDSVITGDHANPIFGFRSVSGNTARFVRCGFSCAAAASRIMDLQTTALSLDVTFEDCYEVGGTAAGILIRGTAAQAITVNMLASGRTILPTLIYDDGTFNGILNFRRDATSEVPEGNFSGFNTVNIDRVAGDQLRETSGPTLLDLGSIADGQHTKRSGTSIIGETLGSFRLLNSLAHSATTGQTANDHHAQLHKDAHKSGGGDAFASGDLLEAQVKRILESGSQVLLVGAIPDGTFAKRVGTALVGAVPPQRLHLEAATFDNPVTGHLINLPAPIAESPVNAGLKTRQFNQTEKGVSWKDRIPAGTTTMKLRLMSNVTVQPAAVRTVGLKLYYRKITDGVAVSAWVGTNDGDEVLDDIDIAVGVLPLEDEQTLTLGSLTPVIPADEMYQFELTRINPQAGTEYPDTDGVWELQSLEVEFA